MSQPQFKTATFVYKFFNSGSPGCSGLSLSLGSLLNSTKRSNHDCQFLTVPPFHSSLYKSVKHFGHIFAFDVPGVWGGLPNSVLSVTSIVSFGRVLGQVLTYLQKPICHSLLVTPGVMQYAVTGLTTIHLVHVLLP